MVDSFRNTEILMFKHYDPNPNLHRKMCVYEEANFAKKFNKYSKELLDQQINDYHNNNYPTNNGLFQSGIYIKITNHKLICSIKHGMSKLLNTEYIILCVK